MDYLFSFPACLLVVIMLAIFIAAYGWFMQSGNRYKAGHRPGNRPGFPTSPRRDAYANEKQEKSMAELKRKLEALEEKEN